MNDIDIEKMIMLAKELGIEVQENSDTPGFFIEKDGIKSKVKLYDLFDFDNTNYTVEPKKIETEIKIKGVSQTKRSVFKMDDELFMFKPMSNDDMQKEVA